MSRSDEMGADEVTLAALIEVSRTPEGREGLFDVLTDTLFLLSASPSRLLLLRLRLLRNLLAGDEFYQYAFIERSGPATVASSVLSFPSLAPDAARAALQALGNTALGGEFHREAVWEALFPEALREFAGVRDTGVLDPLCMVLDTCCGGEGGRGRLNELCHEELGMPILVQVVNTASQGELSELEPPSTIRKSMARGQGDNHPALENAKVCPYIGYRRDLVAVIANCLHGRKRVQNEIRHLGGIMLLLQQCVIDEDNPYLREWGLLAVKNLLEENEENQKEISELEMQEPVITPEIANIGLKVEIDKETGRPKLVNTSDVSISDLK
ncbi:hypothetical protein BAE44_0001461 [Dichanthelium oligosanthes]|uniref:Ataxin-10 domain-containing protein n=1 Tax=Dichanthelium oligosanthes TaxID=888268 RepID=A0A1E5WK53_9POAL|nr:hypothetical protein BAE44_0001461 [Dichanthelium oligosanthes]